MGKLLVILVFVGIGIIRKLAEDAAKQRQKRAANEAAGMPKDKRANVQSEIEAFLQGVTGQKKKGAEKPRPRRQARSQRRQQEAEAEARAQRKQRAQQRAQANARKRQQSDEAKSRPISTVGAHVDQFIDQHVDQHIGHGMDEDVPVEVVSDEAVAEDFAARNRHPATVSKASEIADLLSTPQGMRQAFIAGEVLARPHALRRK